jgi:hypothetical protein
MPAGKLRSALVSVHLLARGARRHADILDVKVIGRNDGWSEHPNLRSDPS